MRTGTVFVRQTLSLRVSGRQVLPARIPCPVLPGVGAGLAPGLREWVVFSSRGVGCGPGRGRRKCPPRAAAGSVLCPSHLLSAPRGDATVSNTCLVSCWRRPLGSGCSHRGSRARLELQVVKGMTDDVRICAFPGERLALNE